LRASSQSCSFSYEPQRRSGVGNQDLSRARELEVGSYCSLRTTVKGRRSIQGFALFALVSVSNKTSNEPSRLVIRLAADRFGNTPGVVPLGACRLRVLCAIWLVVLTHSGHIRRIKGAALAGGTASQVRRPSNFHKLDEGKRRPQSKGCPAMSNADRIAKQSSAAKACA
jgi:hypothetical protein